MTKPKWNKTTFKIWVFTALPVLFLFFHIYLYQSVSTSEVLSPDKSFVIYTETFRSFDFEGAYWITSVEITDLKNGKSIDFNSYCEKLSSPLSFYQPLPGPERTIWDQNSEWVSFPVSDWVNGMRVPGGNSTEFQSFQELVDEINGTNQPKFVEITDTL